MKSYHDRLKSRTARLYVSHWPQRARAHYGFHRMEKLGVFLVPPSGKDAKVTPHPQPGSINLIPRVSAIPTPWSKREAPGAE